MNLREPHAAFEERVRASFARQAAMTTLGARLQRVDAGAVDVALPFRADLTQQHGFLHAGILATVADSAGGYAAYSLMPPGDSVLSVEFKVNLLAPAAGKPGDVFVASGCVVRAGRTITVCDLAVVDAAGKQCLHGTQTLMRVPGDGGHPAGRRPG